ncbi:hypothetical protein GDO86_008681, partial [Hymenochirus boettgeri]
MPIKPFTVPLPETRFFHTSKDIYKFKFHYGKNFKLENIENRDYISKEIEDSVRAVMENQENLHPFSTLHFVIFPYKSKWDSASRLKFKHGQKYLVPFPYVFTIYIESKSLMP